MKNQKRPACFTTSLSVEKKEQLQKGLEERGFTISEAPYAFFSAQKKGISLTFYLSGKLVVQGKEKDAFIEFYLEPEILENFSYTNPHINVDFSEKIGVDEAGKGDFFGPLCIAGIFLTKKEIEEVLELGVVDSKKLSDTRVISIAKKLKKYTHHIICLRPEKYNELYTKFRNLNALLAWSHASVIETLVQKTGCKEALIDQFAHESLVRGMLEKKHVDVNLHQRHRAEEDVVVASASILARNAFLEGLEKLGEMHSITLPKGASALVVDKAKEIVERWGKDRLSSLCKTHFKTYQEVLQTFES